MSRLLWAAVMATALLCAVLAAPRSAPASTTETDEVLALIVDAAAAYGVPAQRLIDVAWCESRFDRYAVGRAGEVGVFQFLPRGGIWSITPYGRQGIGPASVSVEEQIEMAAWLFSLGYGYHWTCARR